MTGAVGMLVRRALRTNLRAVLGLAVVIALAGGVALTAVAAARRTSSAFPRYLEASHASDLAINPVSDDEAGEDTQTSDLATLLGFIERARDLPEVAGDAIYVGLEYTFLADEAGQGFDFQPEIVGSLDGRFIDQDALAVVDGRLPDPERDDEVAVNRQTAAALDLDVGSTVHLVVPDLSGGVDVDPRDVPVLRRQEATVTGIGLFPEEVMSDDVDGAPRLLATPAFTRQVAEIAGSYLWHGLSLVDGASVDGAIRAYEELLPDGYQVNLQRSDTQRDRVARSVRPTVVALALFGAAASVAGLALGALGAVRLLQPATGSEEHVLRALGLSRSRRRLVLAAPSLTAAFVGAGGAAAIAVALSPVGPVGPVREVEPDPGLHLDPLVIGLGAGLLGTALGVVALAAAHRATSAGPAAVERVARPSWLVQRIAATGLGPNAVVGTGHAVGGQGRSDGIPTRATIAACTVAVVALTTAITFGANVRHLLDSPAAYGWAADLAVQSGGGYDYFDPAGADELADADGVEALTLAGFASVALGDREVNALGVIPVEGRPLVTLVDGAFPVEGDEVALGADTARDLDAGIGDEVAAADRQLRVVGLVALPAIGPSASAHPSLGQGALVTMETLSELNENGYPSLALLRVRGDQDPEAEADRLVEATAAAMSESPVEFASYHVDLRPSEVVGLAPASRTAYLLAGVLGAAAVLAVGLTLGASVRRRRRTFAVLAAIGFDGHGLRHTVRWQLNVVMVLAVLVGLPVGVAVGRVAWTAFADQLGVAADPRVPILVLAATSGGLVLLSNLFGEWPARRAGRRPPVATLQSP